jgi:sec-independent protein translocase protein TatA
MRAQADLTKRPHERPERDAACEKGCGRIVVMGTGLLQPIHLLFLLVLALLLFGAKRLPEIGRSLGVGMREFKDSVTGIQDATKVETHSELPPPQPTAVAPVIPAQPVAAQPVTAQPVPAQPVPAQPVPAPPAQEVAAPAPAAPEQETEPVS